MRSERRPRVDGWASRLKTVIEAHQRQPFLWGASDCGVMASDAVRVMTGFNPTEGLRYGSERGALRAFRRAGYASALDLVEKLFPEVDPAHAQRGDLVYPMCVVDPLMSPAVLDGAYAFSKNQSGAVVIPRAMIVRAFAV